MLRFDIMTRVEVVTFSLIECAIRKVGERSCRLQWGTTLLTSGSIIKTETVGGGGVELY